VVRFKVVKGSHLLLAVSIAALLIVVLLIGLQASSGADAQGTGSGAKVEQTFALANSDRITIRVLPDPSASPAPEPRFIRIYHTHTHEAYEQVAYDPYEAVETWRTEDPAHSVVRVGEALAAALEEHGFRVTHDRTDHELDSLSDSYVRALGTLKSYEETFDLYIDLHRDAYVEGMLPHLNLNGTEYAQLMLLVGKGDRYSAENKPEYEKNLRFAQRLTQEMNAIAQGICRNPTVKIGRYNQHIGTPAILLEVGHNRNTLRQAIASMPVVAQAISKILAP